MKSPLPNLARTTPPSMFHEPLDVGRPTLDVRCSALNAGHRAPDTQRPTPECFLSRLAGSGLRRTWLLALILISAPPVPAAESFSAAGITEAYGDVILGASVAGIVNVRKVQEGESIKEGDTILELDKRLEVLELDRRKLVLDAKQKQFVDTQTLFKNSKGVSKDELDKAELEFKVAEVEHQMAAEQLRRRLLIAPFSGTVAEFFLDPGEATQAYQPLAHFVDTQRGYFVCNLEARAALSLKLDQAVQLEIESGAAPVTLPAKISYLSPVVDPASGLLKVKALFDNSAGKLRPGLAGKMRFNESKPL
jgi:RND family efflux transporter MFP subunit